MGALRWFLLLQAVLSCNPTICPVATVSFTQLGDGLCQSNCNTPDCNYDGGDCSPPQVWYVTSDPVSMPDGSFASPFGSLIDALQAVTGSTLIYLLEGIHSVLPANRVTVLNVTETVTISTLLCSDVPVLGCASSPATLQLHPNHLQLTISSSLTLINLVYNGNFPLIEGCSTCKNCPATVVNSAGVVVNSRGEQAAPQSACSPYAEAVLLVVQPNASLSLFTVSFLNLQHQLKSLIYSTCGDIYFQDVIFSNISSKKLPGSGALTIATLQFAAISDLCGRFSYIGGSVQLLYNGFEFSYVEGKFAPFIKADGLVSLEVKSVLFGWNLMTRAVIYMQSFGFAAVENCVFEGNIVVEGPIYISSMAGTTLRNPHFTLKSTIFRRNFGRLSSALLLSFQASPQSVTVENCTFEGNYAETNGVIDLRNYFFNTDFDKSQPVLLRNLTFTGNISPFVMFLNSTANVLLTDVVFTENGDSATGQTGESVVLAQYISLSETYASVVPSNQRISTCEKVLSFSKVSQSTVSNAYFGRNYCAKGSPGLTITDDSYVLPTSLIFEGNTGFGLLSVLSNSDLTISNVTCIGNFNMNSLYSTCLLLNPSKPQEFRVENSVFKNNQGLTSTVAQATGVRKLLFSGVNVTDNTAKTNCAGIKISVLLTQDTLITLENCLFSGNHGNSSGTLLLTTNQASFRNESSGLILLITRCSFLSNTAGSGGSAVSLMGELYLKQSRVIGTEFAGNRNGLNGAAAHLEFAKGELEVNSCVFRQNSGQNGAAVYYHYENTQDILASLMLKNCSFIANTGNSIIRAESLFRPFINCTNNTFSSNKGSSISIQNVYLSDQSSVFTNNSAAKGVALFAESSVITLSSLICVNNSATISGGVMFLSAVTNAVCTNLIAMRNRANVLGGVAYIDKLTVMRGVNWTATDNFVADRGSVIYMHSSTVVIDGGVIARNNAAKYGAFTSAAATFTLSNADMHSNMASLRSPGIAATLSTISVINCTLHDQYGDKGGSVFITDQSVGQVRGTTVWNNSAGSGGAFVVIALSAMTIQDSHAWNCWAATDGGFLSSRIATINFIGTTVENITSTLTFGAVFLLQSTFFVERSRLTDMIGSAVYGMDSVVTIQNSYFARVFAGVGAGLNCAECKSIVITNSTFSGGQAKTGGVLNSYTKGTTPKPLISVITNSRFEHSRAINGGAIASDSFYVSLVNNTFYNNSARSENYDNTGVLVRGLGGAVYTICPSLNFCQFVMDNNTFESNSADISGGGIYWADSFPSISGNEMRSNKAEYGSDIASYGVRLALLDSNFTLNPYLAISDTPLIIEIKDIGSGYLYMETVKVALVDQYDRIVATDYSSSSQLVSDSNDTSVSGNTQVVAHAGIFTFNNITFIGPPTTTQTLLITTNGIHYAKKLTAHDPSPYYPTVSVLIHFRACQIGESLQRNECVPCPVNTFSLDPADTCMNCPANVYCYGTYLMVPEAGYWRPDPMVNLWFECVNEEACLGSPDAENVSLTGLCAAGYTGNLCMTCENTYSAQGNGICTLCPGFTSNIVITTFLVLSVLTMFALIVYISIRGAQRPRSELAIFLKIMLNYVQMIMVASSLNINWPNFVAKFLRGQQMAGNAADQMMSIECILKQMSQQNVYYTNLAVYLAVPGVMMLLCVLFWMCVSWKVERAAQKLVATLVLVIFVLHTSITKAMFSIFTCRELLPGEFWLVSNISIRCWDRDHVQGILTLAIPGIIMWVVGLPTLCLIVLIAGKHKLNDVGMRVRFSFLFKGYRAEWYFWEFVILYRKIIVVCTSVFLTTVSIVMQALSMLAVVLICIFLQQYVKPFFGKDLNTLELKALLASLLTIYAGLYFQTRSTSIFHIDFIADICIFTVILAANGYFLLSWARLVLPIIILTIRERITAIRKLTIGNAVAEQVPDIEKSHTPSVTPEHTPGVGESLTPPNNTSLIIDQSYSEIS